MEGPTVWHWLVELAIPGMETFPLDQKVDLRWTYRRPGT